MKLIQGEESSVMWRLVIDPWPMVQVPSWIKHSVRVKRAASYFPAFPGVGVARFGQFERNKRSLFQDDSFLVALSLPSDAKKWFKTSIHVRSVEGDKTYNGMLDTLKTRVTLRSSGKVEWFSPIMFRISCGINVAKFPFDTQRCAFTFGSFTYDNSKLRLRPESKSADLSKLTSMWIPYLVFVTEAYLCLLVFDVS